VVAVTFFDVPTVTWHFFSSQEFEFPRAQSRLDTLFILTPTEKIGKSVFSSADTTHSLTAALDQLRVVASSTSNDPGPRSGQHQQIGQCLLPLVAANFFVDDPADTFQSAVGGMQAWASIDSCSACKAGVFSGRQQMWPNNEWRLSAIRDGTSGSFVLSLTTAFYNLSYHLIPRIRRSVCMWKDWILSLSTLRIVHILEPYNTTDCTREVYILSLMERLSLCWRQMLSRWAIMEPAMPKRLCISG